MPFSVTRMLGPPLREFTAYAHPRLRGADNEHGATVFVHLDSRNLKPGRARSLDLLGEVRLPKFAGTTDHQAVLSISIAAWATTSPSSPSSARRISVQRSLRNSRRCWSSTLSQAATIGLIVGHSV